MRYYDYLYWPFFYVMVMVTVFICMRTVLGFIQHKMEMRRIDGVDRPMDARGGQAGSRYQTYALPLDLRCISGRWFRSDNALLLRVLLVEPPFVEFIDQNGLMGCALLSRLRRLEDAKPGEWWKLVVCPSHPAIHGFGSLPFLYPQAPVPSWLAGMRERIACGCAMPDDSAHPQG